MTDPNYAHEFVSNRDGNCKQIIGGAICHKSELADVHVRYREMQRCPECGSWGVECANEKPVHDCRCARCASAEIDRLRASLQEIADGVDCGCCKPGESHCDTGIARDAIGWWEGK